MRVVARRIQGFGGAAEFWPGREFERREGGRSRCWRLRWESSCGVGSGRRGRRDRQGRSRMLSRDMLVLVLRVK